jgi:hypothetical protein
MGPTSSNDGIDNQWAGAILWNRAYRATVVPTIPDIRPTVQARREQDGFLQQVRIILGFKAPLGLVSEPLAVF